MRIVTLVLLPAVDVAGGQAVGLARGEGHGGATHGSPLGTALTWQRAGASWIHLVDLDAAFGRGSNAELLAEVVGALDVDVELAGGIADEESIGRALSTGCARVVLSTRALDDLEWCARAIGRHGDRIVVGLDVRIDVDVDGTVTHRLAARGSNRDGGELWEMLETLDRIGCGRYVLTDIDRDGMLNGPNLELLRAVMGATAAPVVASGGIASIDDLLALADLAAAGGGPEGAIVGKALYAGQFTLSEALETIRFRARRV